VVPSFRIPTRCERSRLRLPPGSTSSRSRRSGSGVPGSQALVEVIGRVVRKGLCAVEPLMQDLWLGMAGKAMRGFVISNRAFGSVRAISPRRTFPRAWETRVTLRISTGRPTSSAAEAEDSCRQTPSGCLADTPSPAIAKAKPPTRRCCAPSAGNCCRNRPWRSLPGALRPGVEAGRIRAIRSRRAGKVEWDPFRLEILLPIMPEVDLGDYRSLRATP